MRRANANRPAGDGAARIADELQEQPEDSFNRHKAQATSRSSRPDWRVVVAAALARLPSAETALQAAFRRALEQETAR